LIAIGTANGGSPDDPYNATQYQDILYDSNIDLIILGYRTSLFKKNDPTPSVDEISELIKASLKTPGNGDESFLDIVERINKPVLLHVKWNSAYRQNEFNFFDVSEVHNNVVLDFSDQVKMYEATVEALKDPELSRFIKGLNVHGYWWNDMFDIYYPPHDTIVPASGDKSHNIRNKPVEQALKCLFE